MRNRQGGFTLLEIMIALVVFGFLLLGLGQGVHFGLRAWNGQAATIAKRGDLDAVDRTLRGMIGRMNPGFQIDPPNIVGLPHGLAFTTEMPQAAGFAGPADVSLTVNPQHEFLLRWTPHLHAVRLSGTPAIHGLALLRGVDHVDFGYWRAGRWVGAWNSRTPPALVRISIVFTKQTQHWPAIVAAPMLQPAS